MRLSSFQDDETARGFSQTLLKKSNSNEIETLEIGGSAKAGSCLDICTEGARNQRQETCRVEAENRSKTTVAQSKSRWLTADLRVTF